jgi:hypothetical protein
MLLATLGFHPWFVSAAVFQNQIAACFSRRMRVYCCLATPKPFFFLPALGTCRMTSFSHFSRNFLYLPPQSATKRRTGGFRKCFWNRICVVYGGAQQHCSAAVLHGRVPGVHALYFQPAKMRLAPDGRAQ